VFIAEPHCSIKQYILVWLLGSSSDPALASVIEATSLPLLYVGFGSMEKFMIDTNWEEVFEVLESGVQTVKYVPASKSLVI